MSERKLLRLQVLLSEKKGWPTLGNVKLFCSLNTCTIVAQLEELTRIQNSAAEKSYKRKRSFTPLCAIMEETLSSRNDKLSLLTFPLHDCLQLFIHVFKTPLQFPLVHPGKGSKRMEKLKGKNPLTGS